MAVTKQQRENPIVLGDTGLLDRLCPENIKDEKIFKPSPWKIFADGAMRILGLIKPKPKCRSCGTEYSRLPTKEEFRFDCRKEGCYWMIFSDGSQTHDYPGE